MPAEESPPKFLKDSERTSYINNTVLPENKNIDLLDNAELTLKLQASVALNVELKELVRSIIETQRDYHLDALVELQKNLQKLNELDN